MSIAAFGRVVTATAPRRPAVTHRRHVYANSEPVTAASISDSAYVIERTNAPGKKQNRAAARRATTGPHASTTRW